MKIVQGIRPCGAFIFRGVATFSALGGTSNDMGRLW